MIRLQLEAIDNKGIQLIQQLVHNMYCSGSKPVDLNESTVCVCLLKKPKAKNTE